MCPCKHDHRRKKVSLTEGAKICRFIDYVVKFKSYLEFTNICSYCLKSVRALPTWGTRLCMQGFSAILFVCKVAKHCMETLIGTWQTDNYNFGIKKRSLKTLKPRAISAPFAP